MRDNDPQFPSLFTSSGSTSVPSTDFGRVTLRRVSAIELVRSMRGSNHPMLIRCDDGKYYVVKSAGSCRQPRALANEMFAGKLAAFLGLPVCESVVVDVPQALAAGIGRAMGSSGHTRTLFGSAYPGSPTQVLVTDFLPDKLLGRVANAADAFLGACVFDLWICNRGRREAIFSRPVGRDGGPYTAWIIDHDACFNDGDWQLPETLIPCMYDRRLVYEAAMPLVAFEPFLAAIEGLKVKEIKDAARSVPAEWSGKHPQEILDLADQLFRRRKQLRRAAFSLRDLKGL